MEDVANVTGLLQDCKLYIDNYTKMRCSWWCGSRVADTCPGAAVGSVSTRAQDGRWEMPPAPASTCVTARISGKLNLPRKKGNIFHFPILIAIFTAASAGYLDRDSRVATVCSSDAADWWPVFSSRGASVWSSLRAHSWASPAGLKKLEENRLIWTKSCKRGYT